jgi:hypothetical protein
MARKAPMTTTMATSAMTGARRRLIVSNIVDDPEKRL